jgi:hypothetical protein
MRFLGKYYVAGRGKDETRSWSSPPPCDVFHCDVTWHDWARRRSGLVLLSEPSGANRGRRCRTGRHYFRYVEHEYLLFKRYLPGSYSCPSLPTLPPASNISSGCLYAAANGFYNSGSQTVNIASGLTSPPSTSGVATLYWATVTVTEQNAQLFSGLFGNHTFGGVAAQATAGVFQKPVANCIYALDPRARGSITATGGATVQTSCGIYVNSSNGSALDVSGQGSMTAPVIDIVGTNCYFNPSLPLTNQGKVSDPYSTLPAPTYSGCGQSTSALAISGGSVTLYPGVYCGGISISGQSNVTLSPGIYILNGGGLKISSANASLSGSGVMIYNTANGYSYGPITITGNSMVNLSAPTSGIYSGMLIFQDPAITSAFDNTINGNTDPGLYGALYFPTTPLKINGGSAPTPFTGKIIARTITITGGASFYVSLSGPATGGGATMSTALIQ